jgi:hypothetical protein
MRYAVPLAMLATFGAAMLARKFWIAPLIVAHAGPLGAVAFFGVMLAVAKRLED